MSEPAAPVRQTGGSTRQILSLAWPMLVGQLAVIANGVIDHIMAGGLSATAQASITLGASVYAVVYVCVLGALQALAPVVASQVGANQPAEVGQTWRQGLWLALVLLIPSALLLLHPEPILNLAHAEFTVRGGTTAYLTILAFGLPAALWFRLFTLLNTALARPRTVMVINLLGPFLKVPLNHVFMRGLPMHAGGFDLSIPALGAAGCGLASAIVSCLCAAIGLWMLHRDPFYRPFALRGWSRPERAPLILLIRLGLPIGASYLIDVTAFSLMTLLIGRWGTLTVSAHGIAANLAVALYMVPVALGSATSVLVAQALGGARPADARRIAARGLMLSGLIALGLASSLFIHRALIASLYTHNPQVLAIAMPLIAVVAIYHIFDALQCSLAFILRAWRITLAPMVLFAVALWGVGLGGGWLLTHQAQWGVVGFWYAATAALALVTGGLGMLLYHHSGE